MAFHDLSATGSDVLSLKDANCNLIVGISYLFMLGFVFLPVHDVYTTLTLHQNFWGSIFECYCSQKYDIGQTTAFHISGTEYCPVALHR
eukprot:5360544-Amphidinium_carterae.1